MRIGATRIENFRCLRDVTVTFDDVTVLVGANGSGKSTVLRALDWFFSGGGLSEEDFFRHDTEAIARVSVTFTDFTNSDRDSLGGYAVGDSTIFTRSYSLEHGEKLTGRAYIYPPFDAIRAIDGATPRRTAFNAFVDEHPELGLARVANREQLVASMAEFEQNHTDLLEQSEADASHLFGFVGGPKLSGRFAYVFVPAVSDAQMELSGARGSLLSRLMERLPAGDIDVGAQLEELKDEAQERADTLIREQHRAVLDEVGERITEAVREFVPAAEVRVTVHPPEVRVTEPMFDVEVADDGLATDIAHQGHGFQRALLLATLNELARTEDEGDVPGVFLAIEEPELYQHPLQARHFAAVLSRLPRTGEGSFQVSYATHSPFFVDAGRYERLRRFTRSRDDGERVVTTATSEAVATRLEGIVVREDVERRIRLTLDRQIAEAVFAEVAVLVEGKTDAGLISGIADHDSSFEAQGIAVVNVEGKTKLPLAAAVLGQLGIPTFVVFDADGGKERRLRAAGGDAQNQARIADELANTIALNRRLLAFVGAPEEDWPETTVTGSFAVFADTIEAEWPAAVSDAGRRAREENDDPKREHWYLEAARELAADAPPSLREVVARVIELR